MVNAAVSELLLSVKDLSAERAYRELFSQLSFDISSGDICQVVGANGAGKSTLLKILSGVTSDYSGELFWKGQSLKEQRYDYHQQLMYLGHSKAVKRSLTVLENIAWFMALYPCRHDVTVQHILSQLHLQGLEHTLCAQLSAGQQQRVALSRLLLSSATLWLLDEPFTAIDKKGVKVFESLMVEFAARGGAVMVVTHHDLSVSAPVKIIELGS